MFKWIADKVSHNQVPEAVSSFRCVEMSVSAEVLYDETEDEFVIGYSHQENRFRNVGRGENFSDAAVDLSEAINKSPSISRGEANGKLDGAEETPLDVFVYHSKSDGEYIIVISDGDGYITGRGRNMSGAFKDLSSEEVLVA